MCNNKEVRKCENSQDNLNEASMTNKHVTIQAKFLRILFYLGTVKECKLIHLFRQSSVARAPISGFFPLSVCLSACLSACHS